MDKAHKKARLRAWREDERDAARARLPMDDSDMEAFFDMLDQRLPEVGCDHSHRLTDAWLTERGQPLEQVHQWLENTGGFCDCEALANSEQAWREATRRP